MRYRTEHMFVIWTASELRTGFRKSKTGSSPKNVSRRFLCCSSSLFARRWFYVRRLFCQCLLSVSSFFSDSRRLCFVIMTFSGYLILSFPRFFEKAMGLLQTPP